MIPAAAAEEAQLGDEKMPDEFRQFVKKLARLLVPEDDVEEMQERREHAAHESGRPVGEVTDEDVIVNADDEFLCSETQALWRLIREARQLLKTSDAEAPDEEGPAG